MVWEYPEYGTLMLIYAVDSDGYIVNSWTGTSAPTNGKLKTTTLSNAVTPSDGQDTNNWYVFATNLLGVFGIYDMDSPPETVLTDFRITIKEQALEAGV